VLEELIKIYFLIFFFATSSSIIFLKINYFIFSCISSQFMF
jgi:hypothetical protein